MATDTLSPSATRPVPPAALDPDPYAAADRRTPAIPNPMTVQVSFSSPGANPKLYPPPKQGLLPRENGYQFKNDQSGTRLVFVIDPEDRGEHWFSGCSFAPVGKGRGKKFPMPVCTYRLHSPYELVVDFKFTPGTVEQVHVWPEYMGMKVGPQKFDPQVGNDGGDLMPPGESSSGAHDA